MNYQIFSNKQGFRTVIVPLDQSLTVTVLVLVKTGADYETSKINGIAHFLEHLCFKGTKNRPSSFEIAKELDAIGAEYNAFTGREITGYYIKTDLRQLKKVIDIISDIFLHPLFKEEDIEKEKGVILEEINLYQDLPPKHIYDLLLELLYKNQPGGRPILGKKETVQKITKKDIVSFYRKYYHSNQSLIVVAGNVQPKEIKNFIFQKFKEITKKKVVKKQKTKEIQKRPQIKILNKETDQLHFALAFRGATLFSNEKYHLNLIATLLGVGFSARITYLLREKLGCAYYVGVESLNFTDRGLILIQAGIDSQKSPEILKALLKELMTIKKEGFSEEEVEKGKNQLEGNFVLSLETSDEIANFLGSQLLTTKKILLPAEILDKIFKISTKEVNKVFRKYFSRERLNLAVIGNLKKKHQEEIKKIIYQYQ